MYDMTINGILYSNIIYSDKEYLIQRTGNNKRYNNRYRVVNTRGTDNHTHINNLGVCKRIINLVKRNELPCTAHEYLIMSCYRLSIDASYKKEAMRLYRDKKDKQQYYNKR